MSLVLPPVVDPLGEALHFLRMSGILYSRSEMTSPWALALPPLPGTLMLHVVTSGECWLEVEGAPARLLRAGDLALAVHGAGHQVASEPGLAGAKLFDIPREQVSERSEVIRLGGGGEPAHMVCGVFQFDDPAAHHLVSLLPPVIAVEGWRLPDADWIRSTLRALAAETKELRPGCETVISRLADILVIHVIRSWIEQDPAAQTGWLGALRDRQLGRVIALIHRHPERPWSLKSLAEEAAMSRSSIPARFTKLVGEPAMHYVTRWRMYAALGWLKDEKISAGDAARRLGYDSEAAFSRAFKRYLGMPPGAARRHAPDQKLVSAARRTEDQGKK